MNHKWKKNHFDCNQIKLGQKKKRKRVLEEILSISTIKKKPLEKREREAKKKSI